jgi:membrane associated rhomboid family serine protease
LRYLPECNTCPEQNNISNKNIKKTQQIIEKELIGKLFHALKQNLFVLLRSLLKYSEYKIMPTVTKNLIIINVLVFFGTLVAQRYGIDLTNYLGLHFFLASDFNPAQLITYMFMHGGFSHIFFNMFAVFMFGTVLERTWGPKRFLFYYIACGIGAGLIQEGVQYIKYIVDYSHYSQVDIGTGIIPMGEFLNMLTTVGASGAVYAILLAFGMLFPNNQLFIFPLPFPIKAKFFVIGYALIELYAGFANNPGDNVAHFAHLGGMIFGFILIMYWRKKSRNNGTYYN